MSSRVFFTKRISAEAVLDLYKAVGRQLPGNVAVKVHSGEAGNQNFLHPEFWKDMVEYVSGTVVECNTAYHGARNTTPKHRELLQLHGWSRLFPVDILDSAGPDLVLEIPEGHKIHKNYVGRDLISYDSILVLSHFKGHPMGGFGGAIKQLSIGFASSYGKKYIHGIGDPEHPWNQRQNDFLEAMADAASSVTALFSNRAVYINVMKNLSVDCDCCAKAEDPCMADIGILAGTDPVALDQACVDLVYASRDPGRDKMVERIESRNGLLTLQAAEDLRVGSRDYELVEMKG